MYFLNLNVILTQKIYILMPAILIFFEYEDYWAGFHFISFRNGAVK
jgi:hypothetical protein